MKSRVNRIRRIISVLLIAGGIGCIGYFIYSTISDNAMIESGRDFYSSLAEQVSALPEGSPKPVETAPTSDMSNTPETTEPSDTAATDAPAESESSSEPAYVVPRFDFSSLRDGLYSDIVGWVRSPGTKIDYPVAQGTDNDFYLNHLIDGSSNKIGSIFMDFRNSAEMTDKNTLIYGHHMKNGDMFGSLDSYNAQSYYSEHPTIELYMQNGDYTVELFAGYVVDATTETVPLRFSSTEIFTQYVSDLRARSVFSSDVEVSEDDRLVSFCTCTYTFKNARFILVGKLVSN